MHLEEKEKKIEADVTINAKHKKGMLFSESGHKFP